VQGGIGKDRIKFGLEGELFAIAEDKIQLGIARSRPLDRASSAVEAEHLRASGGDRLGQVPRTAAEIENALAGLQYQPVQQGLAVLTDKGVLVVAELRVLGLCSHGFEVAVGHCAGPIADRRDGQQIAIFVYKLLDFHSLKSRTLIALKLRPRAFVID